MVAGTLIGYRLAKGDPPITQEPIDIELNQEDEPEVPIYPEH